MKSKPCSPNRTIERIKDYVMMLLSFPESRLTASHAGEVNKKRKIHGIISYFIALAGCLVLYILYTLYMIIIIMYNVYKI